MAVLNGHCQLCLPDFYCYIAADLDARFNTSRYAQAYARSLQIILNMKKIGLMKDELPKKIMTRVCGKKPGNKKYNGIKKCMVKCLNNGVDVYRSQLSF